MQILSAFCRHAPNVELGSITDRKVASFLRAPRTSATTWRQKYNVLQNFFLFWVARNAMRAAPTPVGLDARGSDLYRKRSRTTDEYMQLEWNRTANSSNWSGQSTSIAGRSCSSDK
jgi:hypothetical protein